MKSKINPFKEKIKIEMVKKGYTQSKMADLLGISNQAFSAWLNGSNPKIKTLEKIAKILDLMSNDANITIENLTEQLDLGQTVIKKMLSEMQAENLIRRVGPVNGGHWEVIENQ